MATAAPDYHPHGRFGANLLAFCRLLREEHAFLIGPGETATAAQAAAYVGLHDADRLRTALSVVLCAGPQQAHRFDAIFDAFFRPAGPRGVPQRHLSARHTRPAPPGRKVAGGPEAETGAAQRRPAAAARSDEHAGSRVERRVAADDQPLAPPGARAATHYSPERGEGTLPSLPRAGLDDMLEAAASLLRRLRVGRSRRWQRAPAGTRFDFRRTLRSSLQTGGETVYPRWQTHPQRNPHLLVAIDGSRSMSEYAGLLLQFSYALSRRTRRLDVFVFSTALSEVTAQLHAARRGEDLRLTGLHESWGGGTRIGACLETLIRRHGYRCLTDHTVVLLLSDGLDVGEPLRLGAALRELHRRCAAIVWLNPLLGTPGYTPEAQAMRQALPYLDAFVPAAQAADFRHLARALPVHF